MLFRQPEAAFDHASEAGALANHQKWEHWIGDLAAQGHLSAGGAQLHTEGRVMKPGALITDGPFVEIREMLGGFIIVKAPGIDEAIALAKGCPALEQGGSVEVRSVVNPEG